MSSDHQDGQRDRLLKRPLALTDTIICDSSVFGVKNVREEKGQVKEGEMVKDNCSPDHHLEVCMVQILFSATGV